MESVLSRVILILLASVFAVSNLDVSDAVFVILTAVFVQAFLEYMDNRRIDVSAFIIYTFCACAWPPLLITYPTVIYDMAYSKNKAFLYMGVIPLIIRAQFFKPVGVAEVIIIAVIAVILKCKTLRYEKLHDNYIRQRDDLVEASIVLKGQVKELEDKQDYEITVAKLSERNRIAREIHDNVGHVISSSLLQIGAAIVVTKEEGTKAMLQQVKETLDKGMNSIRSSVHNLYDESIDLDIEIKKIVNDFSFCEVKLDYDIVSEMSREEKYSIIAIIKEALSNVAKHSNATEVDINVLEHPKLYQLIILDNGTENLNHSVDGIGLESIRERVKGLNGIVNFSNENGFRIFVSFMKE